MNRSLLTIAALSTFVVVASAPRVASAQSCVQSPFHWSFDGRFFFEMQDRMCSPAVDSGNPLVIAACSLAMNNVFENTPPEPSEATNAIIGMWAHTFVAEYNGREVYRRANTAPAACVFPVGGSPEKDGRVHLIHSPRSNAADPTVLDPNHIRLRGSTSMCLGGGSDTIKVATTEVKCGSLSTHKVVPFNYFGYQFTTFGESGNDRIIGGSGSDTIYGGADRDWLSGGSGADLIYADSGDDTVEGGSGDDYMIGSAGWDFFMDTGGSLDTHLGGADSDCFSDSRSQALYGNEGTDIAGTDTRAGAGIISSVEASTGWCIPW